MSAKSKIEKWLIAEWSSGRVVNSRSMVKVEHQVSNVEVPATSVINDEADKRELPNVRNGGNEDQIIQKDEVGGPSGQQEILDYSSSASSWEPSDEDISSEESEVGDKKTKTPQTMKQYCNKRSGKKGPVPVHRPNAIVPNVLQPRQTNIVDKKSRCKYVEPSSNRRSIKKSLPDSTRKNTPPNDTVAANAGNRMQQILEIKSTFKKLFQMIMDLKSQSGILPSDVKVNDQNTSVANNDTVAMSEDEESDRSQTMESDRSDDNVLITNKYEKAVVRASNTENKKEEEWIPIGSGKTLIHKDKYRKVNWRSYTIATRTLLLATFPRRILATHSLTGKRSPAFQNKPAKMCLDPKIVSDVIIEITSRFKVKENLVRSIITTKCADECKMFKLRMKQKVKQVKNQENVPPIEDAAE